MVSSAEEAEDRNARNSFNFEIAYIKAQPVRTEPTVILVSCAGAAATDAADGTADTERGAFAGPEANVLGAVEGVNARRVALKRRGEAGLRSSGVGYCIVRPSKLLQEPGGYKALVFDQGDRIQQVRAARADPRPSSPPHHCTWHHSSLHLSQQFTACMLSRTEQPSCTQFPASFQWTRPVHRCTTACTPLYDCMHAERMRGGCAAVGHRVR